MGTQVEREPAPLVERGCAPVYFVNGIGKITMLPGGNLMFVFYRLDDDRREVEVKLICSREECAVMTRQTDWLLHGASPETIDAPLLMM